MSMNSRESLVGKVSFPSCENVRSGEVAEQAGANRGAIYQYFGSKQGLLRAALGQPTWHRAPIFHEVRTCRSHDAADLSSRKR